MMNVHESGEMYLEAILVLSRKNGFVRSIDVGEYLGYSKPSVSRAMGLLRKGGLIIMEKDGGLYLTDSGRAIAEKIYERHTVLSKVLVRLGVSETVAVEDACKIEHDISDETFRAVKEHLARHEGEKPLPDAAQTSRVLLMLERKALISLDYREPLKGAAYERYAAYPVRGSVALTARGIRVLEVLEYQGIHE